MQRLRPLTEAECYTRLYGRDGESAVSVIRDAPVSRPRKGLSGEGSSGPLEPLEPWEKPGLGSEEAA